MTATGRGQDDGQGGPPPGLAHAGHAGGADAATIEELANSAADEALTVLLTKLDTFEGRSRFTTWAYKFAILRPPQRYAAGARRVWAPSRPRWPTSARTDSTRALHCDVSRDRSGART